MKAQKHSTGETDVATHYISASLSVVYKPPLCVGSFFWRLFGHKLGVPFEECLYSFLLLSWDPLKVFLHGLLSYPGLFLNFI